MKINSTFLSHLFLRVAAMTALLFAGVTANAANSVFVGNTDPSETVYDYTGFNNESDEGGILHFAVKINAAKLSSFAGAKIAGLRVGWSMGAQELHPEIEASVREDIDGENLASGKKVVSFGYNDILFDTPYTIVADKDVWLGGKLAWDPGSYLATGVYYTHLPEKSQFFATEDSRVDGKLQWIDMTDDSMGLLVFAIVETEGGEFDDKASVTLVRCNEFQSLENPGNAYIVVKNDGANPVTSIELTVGREDKTWTLPMALSRAIEGGQSSSIRGGIQALGAGVHDIWLSKVNDKVVENPVKKRFSVIGIPESVSKNYKRRPLLEYFVSENEYRTPVYIDDLLLPGLEAYKETFTVLSHHCDDQFMIYHEFDEDVDNEDLRFLVDLAGGNKMKVSLPSFTLDRSYYPENPIARADDATIAYDIITPAFVDGLYTRALETPTFASVGIEAAIAGNKIDVKVSGDVAPGFLDATEPVYVTVCLVENNVESTSQEFPGDEEVINRYNGKFTHHNLIRAQLTDMYGAKLDAQGDYVKNFSYELDPSWNKDNMRVVAFVNRGPGRNDHMQVLNSAEMSFSEAGLADVLFSDDVKVEVSGRSITASDGSPCLVYTLDGKRVPSTGVAPGLYLVRVASSAGTVVRKVVVR